MLNKGMRQYRFKDNPIEKRFAKIWEEENTPEYKNGILDYLLADDPNHPWDEVTKRDRLVAATVIQWLGSPVGNGFLREVLGTHTRGY